MRALLDVNVLIALHDSDHVHHPVASRWLQANIAQGWASCPLTQNGCLRIMAQPGYAQPQPLAVLIAMIGQSTATRFHAFWPDDLSLLDAAHFRHDHIHSPRQLTDLYLLALAVRHGGRLVTFDQRIALSAVPAARAEHLVVI
ncbi:MAG: PIN domain-containing protein [Luteimonas sp.]|nr:PIN domain-containing protein [Luteimonas sp.]